MSGSDVVFQDESSGSMLIGIRIEHSRSSGSNDVLIKGTFKNFNTIEDFRKVDQKKKLFDEVVDRVSEMTICTLLCVIHH